MTLATPRRLAALLLVTGLALGTLSDEVPVRAPRQAGGYWMLLGDFHVHAFPGDGGLAPWSLRDEAARVGLDVFAVTNHNRIFTARLAQWLAGVHGGGPLVLAGQEVTNPAYHVIAIGIGQPVNADQSAAGAIAEVHAQGGVAIAAHPGGRYVGYDATAMTRLDGVEVAHPVGDDLEGRDYVQFFQRAQGLNPGVAPIGSSDFHLTPALASCRTWVFASAPTAAGVLEAIRRGTTVAVDQEGRLYGEPELVELVERSGPLQPVDANPVWRRGSLALVWVGVLGLLVFRR